MGIKITLHGRSFFISSCILSFISSSALAQIPAELISLQWALKNKGEPQRIAIDHYTSGQIQGIPGEDLDLPPPHSVQNKIIVAVLDTGIDYLHPQFKTTLAGKGYNFVSDTTDATDVHGHGTHVSGLITSVSQNALILPVKVVQTGPNAPIRPQEVEPGAGTALTETVAKGLEWAIQNGAQVINLSLAWPASIRSKSVDHAMKLAEDHHVLIVTSAGNDSTVANLYPCIYSQVICVGAHSPDGAFTYFSNFGPMVDLLAPGLSILSTWPLNKTPVTFTGQIGYEFRNGTSMASPLVAGMLAELLSRGMSPEEAKSRLLLGTRNTSVKTLFAHELHGQFSHDQNEIKKTARFGNADLSRALRVKPQSLILPTFKAPLDLIWDGQSPTIETTIPWTNQWADSGPFEIRYAEKSFHFNSLKSGQQVQTLVSIPINAYTESAFTLHAFVQDQAIEIQVNVRRVISPSNQLVGGTSQNISGLIGPTYDSIRSVVASDGDPRLDLLFVKVTAAKTMEMQLIQDHSRVAIAEIKGWTPDQLLNPYRLPDQTYALIFTSKDSNQRPSFTIQYRDAKLALIRETKIGTDSTVLSENFKWIKTSAGYQPIWISLGYTPKLDQPAYDPWNPKYKDSKILRIYSVSGNEVRTLKLKKTQLPLQVLTGGAVLIADGYTYRVQYSKIKLDNLEIQSEEVVDLREYRNLVGVDNSTPLIALNGSTSASIALSGPSTPGDLRVTTLGALPADDILSRSSPLEALVQTVGAFTGSAGMNYFAQTHYDLKFYRSGSDQTLSTSLNRYSYIPSLIFNRNFYPLVTQDQNGKHYASIYVSASIANADTSEILIADPDANRILRPAFLRIQAQGCTALGNFIAASMTEPAQLVFICGTELVKLPLTIQK